MAWYDEYTSSSFVGEQKHKRPTMRKGIPDSCINHNHPATNSLLIDLGVLSLDAKQKIT